MKHILLTISITICILSCTQNQSKLNIDNAKLDSTVLSNMIMDRENAMINKDINIAMSQFSENATWINSQGYYFEGKEEVIKFHNMLAGNDSLDYYYEAGKPKIRIIDNNNAIVYYGWKMFWYKKLNKNDTINKEIGLMSLTAKKNNNSWKWIAVTNQYTPWFYDKIEPAWID